MPSPHQFKTKEEFNLYYQEYRKSSRWKRYHRLYSRKWRKKYGFNNELVRQKVRYALLNGSLKKLVCEVCKKVEVEAHHSDYTKPLKVTWLCRLHHRERDVQEGTRKS